MAVPKGKVSSKDAIRDVLPYGSWQLPLWWHAPSAVLCICLTECARSAVPTMAVRSRSSSPWQRISNFVSLQEGSVASLLFFYVKTAV